VEEQRVDLDLPARLVRCRNDDVLDRDRRRLFELAPSMGLGLDENGGGGGRRVGLILLF
jgi:hypothetical protein